MHDVPVVYSFARSGGTLVNQLLGVHRDCLVLSEVNPAASFKPVVAQAVEWLGLAGPHEAVSLSALPYRRLIAELCQRATRLGRRLVVRDWPAVNFLAGTAGHRARPSARLEQQIYISAAGLEPRPVVITRRATAVIASVRRNFPHLESVAEDEFASAYLAYARAVAAHPRFAVEALRERPEETLVGILRALGLDDSFPELLLEAFPFFRNCTGNLALAATSPSATARGILPPEPEPAPADPVHPALAEADRILGYA